MWSTKPRHLLDFVLWPLLAIFWEPISKKHAHWWHWKDYAGKVTYTVTAPADPKAGDRSKGLWANLWYSNFGWNQVIVLEPMSHAGPYQIGFRSDEGQGVRTQLCSLLLRGKTAVQLGPVPTEFFAVDYQGRSVHLQVVAQTTKKQMDKITLI